MRGVVDVDPSAGPGPGRDAGRRARDHVRMEPRRYALIARTAREDVEAFRAYEDAVLPLLTGHGGVLDRRVRSLDGTCEIHLLTFPSAAHLDAFRADPRRLAAQPLLPAGTVVELIEVVSVAEPSAGDPKTPPRTAHPGTPPVR